MEEMICFPDRMIFRSGDYPDKEFSMTPEELLLAAGDDPVQIDAGHPSAPSPLDGKLGHVTNRIVKMKDGVAELFGDIHLPAWMQSLLPEGESNLSCTWDRATKALSSLSLVTNPRIPDAVLYAAFAASRHDTPEGQGLLQTIHDMAASSGAKCIRPGKDTKKDKAEMHSGHEKSAVQAIHDTAADHGAKCHVMPVPGVNPAVPYVGGAYYSRQGGKEKANMTLWDKFKAALGAVEVEETTETPPAATSPAATSPAAFAQTPPAEAVNAQTLELAKLKAELAATRVEKREAEAAAFADSLKDRIYPTERDGIIAMFCELAEVDDVAPKQVVFSFRGQAVSGSRLEQFKATYLSRPQHKLTEELLRSEGPVDPNAPVEFSALMNRSETPVPVEGGGRRMDPAKLMQMTGLGQAALDAAAGNIANGKGRN